MGKNKNKGKNKQDDGTTPRSTEDGKDNEEGGEEQKAEEQPPTELAVQDAQK